MNSGTGEGWDSRSVLTTTAFERDLKRMRKRGKDLGRLEVVVNRLRTGRPLELRQRDHLLVGDWKGFRECHIEPDWLLIDEIDATDLILTRTGSHSDLLRR